ncbi:MAG: methyltransferase domain-containing protein [Bacteroidales bacterium]|nr:methyltransferase domain-containing protein [Bacteroidales bacterium]
MTEITTPADFQDLVNGFRVSRIILTGAELKVFDHLLSPGNSSETVAGFLGTDPRGTNRLLNALVAIGLLRKANGMFSNTAFSDKFLVSSSPFYLSNLNHTNRLWKSWSTLTDALIAGTSVAVDQPINERSDDWQEAFIAAMHRRAGPQAIEVADVLDLIPVLRVLDVGGGSGAFTQEFLKRNPKMTGVVFDLPNIVGITKKYLTLSSSLLKDEGQEYSGIQNRISVIAGDYLRDSFGSGYDLVFMSAIIHINSPEENRLLVQKGVQSLNPGGQLVILDHIMSKDRTEPTVGAIFAINMLVGTKHGDTYTEQELRSWMREAGLQDITIVTTQGGVQIMIGRK